MVEKLTESELETGLEGLSEWSRSGDAIQRTYSFADFLGSIAFVNAIAARAEEVQHHPDILIRYSKVTLTLSTHDCNGLSEKDLAFAADSDRFYSG
ncbi:MAG: 4a-hydroxytetrahydrobiopterin dehydratase [Phycisphaerales bacterium]|nr:4a-hydroxytetrahydrobiopterin dehydratase [Phycisphaerales bacterium]